jgi:hypothetical protein
MSEESVLICRLCVECEPEVESHVDTCHDCRRALWRAFSSPKCDMVLCAMCAVKRIRAEGVTPQFEKPTKEQVEDIRWWQMNFGGFKQEREP